jgi:DNA polymerase-4
MSRTLLFAEVPGFYAAIERAEDPALSDRPVIVGGDPRKRGRVQAATADALASGVEVEMPMLEALQRCTQARAIRTNMRHYREVSRRLLATLRSVHERLEPFGLGAAYADVSAEPAADAIAERMRDVVAAELGLPLRVGLAAAKFVARLAAEEAGESGVRHVGAAEQETFLAPLPATRLDGVGRKTAAALAELGARSIGDVCTLGRDRLQEAFGPHGLRIHALACGRDDERVRASRHPQSVSRESTLGGEPTDIAALSELLAGLSSQLEAELRRQGLVAGKVSLKIRYADQVQATRTRTLPAPTSRAPDLLACATRLLERTQAGRPVRGLGLQLSSLAPATEGERQLDLFRTGS